MEALAKARRGEEEEPAEQVFESTGSESGLVEPKVEAAGIEPAQFQIERARILWPATYSKPSRVAPAMTALCHTTVTPRLCARAGGKTGSGP
jgi:hypothetical protein